MSSQSGELPEYARGRVYAGAHVPRGYMEQAGGFRPAAHTPIQTPLTTYRHGNQGAQEGDAGWAEGV